MERERFAWKCLLHALRPYGPPEVWQASFGPDMETALSEEEQALLRRASGIVVGTAKLDASESGLLSIVHDLFSSFLFFRGTKVFRYCSHAGSSVVMTRPISF